MLALAHGRGPQPMSAFGATADANACRFTPNTGHLIECVGMAALLQENKALQATGEIRDRLEAPTKSGGIPQAVDAPLLSTGVHEFKSSRDPSKVYRVTFGGAGHLECTCEGFRRRGNCKHVREVRESL
jgi:hypothetical protein